MRRRCCNSSQANSRASTAIGSMKKQCFSAQAPRADMASGDVVICDDQDRLAQRAAAFVAERINQARPPHRFLLALTGGSTPAATYRQLATMDVDWSRTHFLLSDERCVPLDDENSNYRMAFENLLGRIPVGESQIHPVRTELSPEAAAEDYESLLRSLGDAELPAIDLVLLGLGSDGHTASLFPAQPEVEEHDRLVLATRAALATGGGPMRRVTFTLPLINAARGAAFIAAGTEKASTVSAALGAGSRPSVPAARVRPPGGVTWLLDKAAAAEL
ncbi:MAG: 6-phosphogluconolactonase [Dehalococcoidia bacterium]|nr:6-phosphogluconolactonase [Dehalococcoidia bacterium]